MRAIKCCSVVFDVMLRLLVINISSLSPAINKRRRLLPAISFTTCGTVVRRRRVDNIWPVAALNARSKARYRLRIAISAYPHLHSTLLLGMFPSECRHAVWYDRVEKLEWLSYPTVKKNWRYVYSFWQNSPTWRSDTAWRLRPRLHTIAWQKLMKMTMHTDFIARHMVLDLTNSEQFFQVWFTVSECT